MNLRRTAVVAAGFVALAVPAALPAHAAPAASGACYLTAFGHALPYVCGSRTLSPDWDHDGQRDEVFAVSPPNNYIYRVSAGSNGPVRVGNGRAATMSDWEIRPSMQRRVYAVTATNHVYYSYYGAGGWSDWYPYVP
ncbi:hypothetical protein ACH4C2_04130 [Streptomyces sp. NPDC018057]|uniref:hypothetical protein n=1 Tax=unclassified Streptomyces TaxID=2593676 RepID=UPI00378CCF34